MDPRRQLAEILPRLNELVGSLSDTELDAPTACSQFAVRDILRHMIGGATLFAGAFRGEAPLDGSEETDATATGKPYDPPDKLVGEIDAFSRQAITEEMRDGDTFAAAVQPPTGASRLTQLVAFTGRRV